MPSSYSASLRFELQFTGENVNTWGVHLNSAISRIDYAIAGIATINTDGGIYTLTATNTADDEARAATLLITGLGGTVVIPELPKRYRVINDATSAVVISAGNITATVDAGDIVDVVCTGTNVFSQGYTDSGGNRLTIKQYIAAQVLGSLAGMPATSGNAGKFLYTNGSSALWRLPVTTDISDYTSDQAAKSAAALGRAIAFAIAL
jgi:hypothetical protein